MVIRSASAVCKDRAWPLAFLECKERASERKERSIRHPHVYFYRYIIFTTVIAKSNAQSIRMRNPESEGGEQGMSIDASDT